jgi:endonuclease/exonuclease/phosphatase family metal-dependent hydrolase
MRARRLRLLVTATGSIILTVSVVWLAFVLQPFGRRGLLFATVATVVASLRADDLARLGRRVVWRTDGWWEPWHKARPLSGALTGVLTCWLGLIAWSSLSPGGSVPPPKADPTEFRVVTWNILHGTDDGPPWGRWDWPTRKRALHRAIRDARPDVLCVQEGLSGQVEFLEALLPGHRRVGVGRDDGRSGGEHCAIFFDRGRFEEVDGGTFWLEEPADRPPDRPALGPKRICTWVRLHERQDGRSFRIYNTHLYLTEPARQRATRLILAHVAGGDPDDAVLVAGDFNAPPGAPCRRLFDEAGLTSSAELAGGRSGLPTYHFYGMRLKSLDGILVDQRWRVRRYRILDEKPGNTFPSDHFGDMADLTLSGGRPLDSRGNP